MTLDGQKVLSYLEASGSLPALDDSTGCSFDSSNSTYDAGPSESCTVHFQNALLKPNWALSKLTGAGAFSVQVQADQIQVTIHPGGGFRPETFEVKQSATQAECRKVEQTVEKIFK